MRRILLTLVAAAFCLGLSGVSQARLIKTTHPTANMAARKAMAAALTIGWNMKMPAFLSTFPKKAPGSNALKAISTVRNGSYTKFVIATRSSAKGKPLAMMFVTVRQITVKGKKAYRAYTSKMPTDKVEFPQLTAGLGW